MGSYLCPLFPLFRIGAGMSPGYSNFLPGLLCPVSPKTTPSCDGTTITAESGGEGPSDQTPSAGHIPAGCMGYGIGRCRHWVPPTLWDRGPRSMAGPPKSTVSATGWRARGMSQWYGSVFRWWQWRPRSSPCSSHGSVLILSSSIGFGPGWTGTPPPALHQTPSCSSAITLCRIPNMEV